MKLTYNRLEDKGLATAPGTGLGGIVITLSRRNLLALLHKLDMPGSGRTIYKTVDDPDGGPQDSIHIQVHVEEDREHYQGVQPGPMHPLTEAFIATHATKGDL